MRGRTCFPVPDDGGAQRLFPPGSAARSRRTLRPGQRKSRLFAYAAIVDATGRNASGKAVLAGCPTLPPSSLSLTKMRVPHPLRRARSFFLRSEQRVGVTDVEADSASSQFPPSGFTERDGRSL